MVCLQVRVERREVERLVHEEGQHEEERSGETRHVQSLWRRCKRGWEDRGGPVTTQTREQQPNDYMSTHMDALPYTMYIYLYMNGYCMATMSTAVHVCVG